MGYNTVLIVLNDGLNDIANDTEFGKKVSEAAGQQMSTQKRVDVQSGCHANCASVVAQHHADVVSLIAVGGNYATVLGEVWNGNKGHHEMDDQIRILSDIVDKFGYKLKKK